jgi:hypothetical protein
MVNHPAKSIVRRFWLLTLALGLNALFAIAEVHAQGADLPPPTAADVAAPSAASDTHEVPASPPPTAAATALAAPVDHTIRATSGQDYVGGVHADRLEAALVEHAHASRRMQNWAAASEIVVAGVLAWGGVRMATDKADGWGTSRASLGLSSLFIALGASALATAITRFVTEETSERRLERWNELSDSEKHDPKRRARFEGELAAEADLTHAYRLSAVPIGIGFVAGGGVTFGLAAAEFSGPVRMDGYILASCALAVGAVEIVMSVWTETLAQKIWRRYNEPNSRDALGVLHLPIRESQAEMLRMPRTL